MTSNDVAASAATAAPASWRLAGAPISWGICEVPGWGFQMAPERVLSEMAQLGLAATELGPPGWLAADGPAVRAALAAHGLALVGGFVPLVLHEPDATATMAEAERVAAMLAAGGAELFVAAAIVDAAWSPRVELTPAQWDLLCERLDALDALVKQHGLTLALHPHAGTLVEQAADMEQVLARSQVGWCFDPGHLVIGGYDPVEFLDRHGERVVHVHLKDVDAGVAERFRAGGLSLLDATREGLFVRLGDGDGRIAEAVERLRAAGYAGWVVLEQDAALEAAPADGQGPRADVAACVDYLASITDRGGR